MIPLCIQTEGPTELGFCKKVLAPHLLRHSGIEVRPRSVYTGRARGEGRARRGGVTKYARAKKDLLQWMKECRDGYFTTMLDWYGLPGDFPEYARAAALPDCYEQVRTMEEALKRDICGSAGNFNPDRFIPYIQLHEFEALVLVRPAGLGFFFSDEEESAAIRKLEADVAAFESPERIDKGPDTAPSKRLQKAFPAYRKVEMGVAITEAIGLEMLRGKCRHFDAWLKALESIKPKGSS